MYEATKKKNEKLGGLDNQMVKVEEDFDDLLQSKSPIYGADSDELKNLRSLTTKLMTENQR